jgi:hypothetical protein
MHAAVARAYIHATTNYRAVSKRIKIPSAKETESWCCVVERCLLVIHFILKFEFVIDFAGYRIGSSRDDHQQRSIDVAGQRYSNNNNNKSMRHSTLSCPAEQFIKHNYMVRLRGRREDV